MGGEEGKERGGKGAPKWSIPRALETFAPPLTIGLASGLGLVTVVGAWSPPESGFWPFWWRLWVWVRIPSFGQKQLFVEVLLLQTFAQFNLQLKLCLYTIVYLLLEKLRFSSESFLSTHFTYWSLIDFGSESESCKNKVSSNAVYRLTLFLTLTITLTYTYSTAVPSANRY